MASLNKVFIIGNLTRDIELRYTPKGSPVADMSVAVNRKWKNDQGQMQEEVTFVDVALWGKTAESCAQYLKKGRPVHIEGRLELQTWDDKQTGQKRSKLRVVAEGVQFLGGGQGEGQQQQTARSVPQQRPAHDPNLTAMQHTGNADDDDIPFN